MIDQSYLHQLDPFAIQFTETFGLRWYGLAYISGFLVAWASIRWMGQKKITPIHPKQVGDFMFAAIVGVLIGGRLGYCLFYDPSMFYTFTNEFPWWKVLAIQDGGMENRHGKHRNLLRKHPAATQASYYHTMSIHLHKSVIKHGF